MNTPTWIKAMTLQAFIDKAVEAYNTATHAHKRAPVEAYVKKQLEHGEVVEILSGHPRWSSALRFSGSPDAPHVEFVINPALPGPMMKLLEPMKKEFEKLIE